MSKQDDDFLESLTEQARGKVHKKTSTPRLQLRETANPWVQPLPAKLNHSEHIGRLAKQLRDAIRAAPANEYSAEERREIEQVLAPFVHNARFAARDPNVPVPTKRGIVRRPATPQDAMKGVWSASSGQPNPY